ncbi:CoA transferase [Yinghuangia seranimata]|uniref:CoA transferase n=1 Tax=Yinghuangia seranimata TaxID=408067 RepID=UPI00248B053E|nr:CoA transferase [Yinghuangia seranimata]MDI2129812.1 CoA transferase [Yinghuangia seranimata]
MRPSSPHLLDEAWRALGGDPSLTDRVTFTGRPDTLPARLPVTELAQATTAAVGLAGAELAAVRASAHDSDAASAPAVVPPVTVDSEAVAISFTSQRHLRLNGRPLGGMNPLSKFFACADGVVRTQANYPHHRAALFAALGLPAEPVEPEEEVAAAFALLTVAEAEERVREHGGLAYAVRSAEEWRVHPQGAALAEAALLDVRRIGGPSPRRLGPAPGGEGDGPLLPASGVRVLDFTRVFSGPVGTRALALLGADVLRIDPEHIPELPGQHLDFDAGKRSATLDLRTPEGLGTLDELLADADVVVTGYRPDALPRFGLSPEALIARHPGLIVATVSAWGGRGVDGPWSDFRGFDSIVQCPTGIAHIEADADDDPAARPAALPAQALDYATGNLLAAGVLRALTERQADGTGTHIDVALARTATWLVGHHDPAEHLPRMPRRVAAAPHLGFAVTEIGEIAYALPPFRIKGGPEDWPHPALPWGASPPAWW